jgi:hypothetical protein
MAVAGTHPDPYFVPTVIDALEAAWSFESGRKAGRLLAQHARFLTLETLRQALHNWCENYECRKSFGMPELAVELAELTAHLGAGRAEVFAEFLANVRGKLDDDEDNLGYSGAELVLRSAGHLLDGVASEKTHSRN